MITIYKYPLQIADEQAVMLPIGAKILSFANQFETPVIWALVDTDVDETELNEFNMFGTGHEIPRMTPLTYIGSAQFQGGEFVWHLFRA